IRRRPRMCGIRSSLRDAVAGGRLSNEPHPRHRSLRGWGGGRCGRADNRQTSDRSARPAGFHRQSRPGARHARGPGGAAVGAGRQVLIDSRGGAGGTVGSEVAVRSAPDGYTLVMHTISSAVLNKFLYPRVNLDVATQFAPISQIGIVSQMLAVNAKVPAQSLQEFIALAKANPGKYHYGSSGLGAIM